jgi:quinol-cytochrome oxidoreductase complex cytochrome b subunit
MSFWGATVITNLFSAIPLVGDAIVTLLWGGFSVDNPTLNRFFALHYLFPFLIFGVVVLHVIALHVTGSNNPTGIDPKGPQDTVPFHPYYTVKDSVGLAVFVTIMAAFVFFAPDFFGEPENYLEAAPLKTPAHIVPEWYFLPFYAILRSVDFDIWFIEAKLGGVLAMFGSIFVLFVLPWLDKSPVRSGRYRPVFKWFFLILLLDCLLLGYVGGHSPDNKVFDGVEWLKVIHLGYLGTFWYFFHFLILLPLLGIFERPKPLPKSISESVLGGGSSGAAATAKPMEKA